MSQTIAAIATASAAAGIGVIRISGENAATIADKVFKSVSGQSLAQMKGYTAAFGHVFDADGKIDEAVGILSIKTKIFAQDFPRNGCFTIAIPSQDTMQDLSVVFHSMSKDPSIEHWKYTIKSE